MTTISRELITKLGLQQIIWAGDRFAHVDDAQLLDGFEGAPNWPIEDSAAKFHGAEFDGQAVFYVKGRVQLGILVAQVADITNIELGEQQGAEFAEMLANNNRLYVVERGSKMLLFQEFGSINCRGVTLQPQNKFHLAVSHAQHISHFVTTEHRA